jgi:hypothetical protein
MVILIHLPEKAFINIGRQKFFCDASHDVKVWLIAYFRRL